MQIDWIVIENALGFRRLNLTIDTDLQIVAGPNNAGKSSLIRILEAYFSDPSGDEILDLRPLNQYYRDSGARTLIKIRVGFTNLTEDEAGTFNDVLLRDGSFWIEIRCTRRGQVTYTASRSPSVDEAHRLYLEVLSLFHFVKIPSVRVTSSGDTSELDSLARLLDTLEAMLLRSGPTRSTNLQLAFAEHMKPLEDMVRTTLDESAAAIAADLPFQEMTVTFRLPDHRAALRGMLESAVIESAGDVEVAVAQRGTGFQSALVLGILKYVAEREAQHGANLLFAVEEPEAFLHPQTQRAMAKILRELSATTQLLVTTHSSVLVDSFDIRQITRLPLEPEGTTFKWFPPDMERSEAGRLTRYCNAANSELVFANAVVFVEGESDFPVLERLLSRACSGPGGHYARGITVIESGGAAKIPHLMSLARHFGVRSYAVVDVDTARRDGNSKRKLEALLAVQADDEGDQISRDSLENLRQIADTRVESLQKALALSRRINNITNPFGIFVMTSDLEGMLLDALGIDGVINALNGTDDPVDEAFARSLRVDPDGYERLTKWLGSKGWNSDLKPSQKLKPHLAAPLLESCLEVEESKLPASLRPLVQWVDSVATSAQMAPI